MFTYKPNASQHKPRTIPTTKLLLALGALIIGLVIISTISNVVYKLNTRDLPRPEELIYPAYEERVKHETEVTKLAKSADGLTKKQMFAYATLNFKRASELDPNYRDMAYGWAYALLQTKNTLLSQTDLEEIRTAIERAESVDPLYPPVLELKKLLADLENNQDIKTSVEHRLQLLKRDD